MVVAGVPSTMRAAWYTSSGPSNVLEIGELPVPKRKPGQALVEVHFSSVNPVDWKMRQDVPPFCKFVPSADISGVVVEADESSSYRPGDKVFAMMPMLGSVSTDVGKVHYGGCAQFACVSEKHLARLADSVPLDAAAGVPLVGLTAVQNLKKANLISRGSGDGRHVAVLAGAGGVGNWAIQLCKFAGCTVTTTASTRNHEFLQRLGADKCIDYNTTDWSKAFDAPLDVVFDLMGGDDEIKALRLLPRDGHYLNIMNSGWITKFGKPGFLVGMGFMALYRVLLQHVIGPNYHFTIVDPHGEQLQHLADLMASGECQPVVDSVIPLSEIARAHDKVEASHCVGKVIIAVKGDTNVPQSRL